MSSSTLTWHKVFSHKNAEKCTERKCKKTATVDLNRSHPDRLAGMVIVRPCHSPQISQSLGLPLKGLLISDVTQIWTFLTAPTLNSVMHIISVSFIFWQTRKTLFVMFFPLMNYIFLTTFYGLYFNCQFYNDSYKSYRFLLPNWITRLLRVCALYGKYIRLVLS